MEKAVHISNLLIKQQFPWCGLRGEQTQTNFPKTPILYPFLGTEITSLQYHGLQAVQDNQSSETHSCNC